MLLHHRLVVLAQLAVVSDVTQDQLHTVLVARAIAIAVHPAGLIQKALGFLRIVRISLERRIIVGLGRIPEGDIDRVDLGIEQVVDNGKAVRSQCDGPAYVHIQHGGVGRIGVDVQEPALIVSRGNGNDVHRAAGFQGLDLVGGQEHADICIAGDDRSFLGGIIRHNADEDLFQFRGVDPVGIGLENDVTARLPLTEDKRTHTDGRRLVPGRVVDRALFFEHRAQDMLRQDPVVEQIGQPGGKGFRELDDQGCVILSGDAFHIILERIAAVDNILVRHDHLVAEHKVIGGDRFAIAPGHIIPQLDGDGLAVSAQAAILGGRDFGSDLRHRLVVIVE